MSNISNQGFIKGLINRDEKIITCIYKKVFPIILDYVSCNNGSYQDAEDVFQEAMLILLEKTRSKSLILTCRFTTYFWGICKKVWLKELRNRKRTVYQINYYSEKTDNVTFDSNLEMKQIQLFLKHFKNLSKDCKKVLFLHFDRTSLEEITTIMGYRSLQISQNKKYRCKKRLMELIMKDPEFTKLQNGLFITH